MLPAFIGGVSRSFGASSDEIPYLDRSILVLQKMGYNSVTKHILKNFIREIFLKSEHSAPERFLRKKNSSEVKHTFLVTISCMNLKKLSLKILHLGLFELALLILIFDKFDQCGISLGMF